jgi:hypothetical protein
MYFRFGSAIVLVVLISLVGIALEKRNLQLRRQVTRQRFRHDVLHDEYIRLRLETQRLGAPAQTIDAMERASARQQLLSPQTASRLRQRPLSTGERR